MDTSPHTLSILFEQLGLASDSTSIETFLRTHGPIPGTVALPDAEFWNSGQSAFLSEAIAEDSDWAEQVDALDAMLRSR